MKVPVQLLVFLIFYSLNGFGESVRQALISSVEGKVEVLTPIEKTKNVQQVMTFEGEKYSFVSAKIGQKVQSKQVILSSTDGKAKLIYSHGDVVIVGPSTAVVIPTVSEKSDQKKELPLIYGKIRSVIDKEGPLSQIKIKTPSAVAGVRGTDLYVAYNPAFDKTEVQVLRGEVEVSPQIQSSAVSASSEPKTFTVKASEKLVTEAKETSSANIKPEVKTEVVQATQQDLVKVKEETTVVAKADIPVPEEVKKEIEKVETKAFENVVKDIRRYDEKVAEELEQKKIASVDEANTMVIDKLKEKAPVVESPAAPYEKENKSYFYLGGGPDLAGPVVRFNFKLAQNENTEFRTGIGHRVIETYWDTGTMGVSFEQKYIELPLSFVYRKSDRWAYQLGVLFLQKTGDPRLRHQSMYSPNQEDFITIVTASLGVEYRFSNRWLFGFEYNPRAKMTNKQLSRETEYTRDYVLIGLGYIF